MSKMTREQFASAVAAAISSVDHLYREVDRLIAGLRDGLGEAPNALAPVRGNLGKSSRNKVRFVVRHEYGLLFGPVTADDEAEEDEEDLDDDAEGEGVSGASQKKGTLEVVAGQPLLAVRVGMYNPSRPETSEPELQYAVMSDWAVGNASVAGPGQRFVLQPHMFRRIPKALALNAGAGKGARCQTLAAVKRVIGGKKGVLGAKKERRLSCRLPMGVEGVPLFSLDESERLDRLTHRIKEMWSDACEPGRSP